MVDTICGVLSGGPSAQHVRKYRAAGAVANLVCSHTPSLLSSGIIHLCLHRDKLLLLLILIVLRLDLKAVCRLLWMKCAS